MNSHITEKTGREVDVQNLNDYNNTLYISASNYRFNIKT